MEGKKWVYDLWLNKVVCNIHPLWVNIVVIFIYVAFLSVPVLVDIDG